MIPHGEWTSLGDGVEVMPYTDGAADAPVAGLLWRHGCPSDPRGPEAVTAAQFAPGRWSLLSSNPLTVGGSLLCTDCGRHGLIRDGRWVPA